ncbi:MAG: hypothetical protein HPY45_05385 [Anaerolineae bacterium]|nr:hypothetical protein [Anaerolineae bacterium]
MNLSSTHSAFPLPRVQIRAGVALAIIILVALIAFEMFNYSTTDYALSDLLGNLKFMGFKWSTILAIAFCGIDFAGIARLFTSASGADEPKEVWYLFGAWFLAATMNAMLTWWGVSMAILNHNVTSTAVMNPDTITKVVPIFVAVMIWVIRILIIGTISLAGEHFLSPQRRSRGSSAVSRAPVSGGVSSSRTVASNPISARAVVNRSMSADSSSSAEPTYHRML